jgi:hypothetical protein
MNYYIQCLLTKFINGDCLKIITWIPEKYAIRNKVLKLKNETGIWTNGWVVQETYNRQNEDFIKEHERDFAKQRQASDI